MGIKCPVCEESPTWIERSKFERLIPPMGPMTPLFIGLLPSMRRIAPCPNCNTPLIWSRSPFILSNLFGVSFDIWLVLTIFDFIPFTIHVFVILLLIAFAIGGIQKLEVVESEASESNQAPWWEKKSD